MSGERVVIDVAREERWAAVRKNILAGGNAWKQS